MKKECEIQEDWKRLDNENIEQVCYYIRKHEIDIREYIADIIASLCDVDKYEMLSKNDTIFLVHARWLYWYAYRYMTNESYGKMSANTRREGHPFTLHAIQAGVNKMGVMIEREPLWVKRWTILKRIIKLRDAGNEEKKEDTTIVIQVPEALKDNINIKIKEK